MTHGYGGYNEGKMVGVISGRSAKGKFPFIGTEKCPAVWRRFPVSSRATCAGASTPGSATEVVQHRDQIIPAPILHLQIRRIDLPLTVPLAGHCGRLPRTLIQWSGCHIECHDHDLRVVGGSGIRNGDRSSVRRSRSVQARDRRIDRQHISLDGGIAAIR